MRAGAVAAAVAALLTGACVDKTPPPLWPTPPPPTLAEPLGVKPRISETPASAEPAAVEPAAAPATSPGDPIGPWRPRPG
jgi:hypothetical protein